MNRAIDFGLDFTEEEETVFETKAETKKKVPKKSKRERTTEDVIAQKYKLGMTLKQIIEEHGVSYGKIYDILNRKGIPLKQGRYNSKSNDRLSVMSDLEKQSLAVDYKGGMTLAAIYDKYDINKHGCYAVLDELKVSRKNEYEPTEDQEQPGVSKPVAEVTSEKEVTQKEGTIDVPMYSLQVRQEGDTLYIEVSQKADNPINTINVSLNPKGDI